MTVNIFNPKLARPVGVMLPEEWSEEAKEAVRKRNDEVRKKREMTSPRSIAPRASQRLEVMDVRTPRRRSMAREAEDRQINEVRKKREMSKQQTDMAVGDLSSDKKGSGARANRGKVALSLFPMHLLAGAARIFMGGAMKYVQWNWAKGMPHSSCVDCFLRHFNKYWYLGEDIDEESGEHHLDHMICNLIMLRHSIIAFKEGDDRPPKAITHFDEAWDFATGDFDEEAYLERNPAVRKKLDELQRTREQD